MDWETVKGFCRRQTQAAKEKMSNAPHTVDATLNTQIEEFVKLRSSAHTTETKLALLQQHLDAASSIISELGTAAASGHQNEEVLMYARKMEIFGNETNARIATLSATFSTTLAELKKFQQEASQLELLVDDRRDKVLEYDFFKNKLDDLRAKPPADTSRIPRNEGRMIECKKKYDDATNRLSSFMSNSRIGGESALLHASVAVCNEYGKYLEEMARTARALLIDGGGLNGAVRQAVQLGNTASNIIQSQVQQVQQQYQQQQSTGAQQVPASEPQQQQQQQPPTQAKSGRNRRDDPFAL